GSFPSEKVVATLVEFLRVGTNSQKANAVVALMKLASVSEDNRNTIVREGAIPLLEVLVNTGTEMQKQSALDALEKLRPEVVEIAKVGDLLRSVAVGWVAS
ncbi:hypothetical protein PF010_g22659, partial [Phytophthora fragariae]